MKGVENKEENWFCKGAVMKDYRPTIKITLE